MHVFELYFCKRHLSDRIFGQTVDHMPWLCHLFSVAALLKHLKNDSRMSGFSRNTVLITAGNLAYYLLHVKHTHLAISKEWLEFLFFELLGLVKIRIL